MRQCPLGPSVSSLWATKRARGVPRWGGANIRPQPPEHPVKSPMSQKTCEGCAEVEGVATWGRIHVSLRWSSLWATHETCEGHAKMAETPCDPSHLSLWWGSLWATKPVRGVTRWEGVATCDRSHFRFRWSSLCATKPARGVPKWGGGHATAAFEFSVEPPMCH